MIESKMTEEARAALRQMIPTGVVEFAFRGNNPVTLEQTRFIGMKAKRKMFSKTSWKGHFAYGDGTRTNFVLHGSDEAIEKKLWEMLLVVDKDFQQMQRREAMGIAP